MLIVLERRTTGQLRVSLDQVDDLGAIQIRVGVEVSAGDSGRALFESGAAVQQAGTDFLVSIDWLRREAAETTGDQVSWDAGFAERLGAAVQTGAYVAAYDAIRVPVLNALAGEARPVGDRG